MPIHLIWGDDAAATEREIEKLIKEIIDPLWRSINLSQLDGTDIAQANQSLEEIRTPPFGNGGRLVLLKQSPFCNNCSTELAKKFEDAIDLMPSNTHLILNNPNKPDRRLKTTKSLQKLINSKKVLEKSFTLPAIWDGVGQRELLDRTANEIGLKLEQEAANYLVEAIGNDSSRLHSELMKLALHAQSQSNQINTTQKDLLITSEAVKALIKGITTSALEVGNFLLAKDRPGAIAHIDALLDKGEPALKIIATITGQIRGWLWVSLLEMQGERDVSVIAKAAGISNPKRIYIMRKQLQGRPPNQFLKLLSDLLEIEGSLKRGIDPKDAFRDGLMSEI